MRGLFLSLCALYATGCEPVAGASAPAAAPPAQVAPGPPQENSRKPLHPAELVRIPAGTLLAGSAPGSPGRDARREAAIVPVELAAFEIDRLPFPNDPEQPPRTGVSRAQAETLCSSRGKRLCSELEWERACKGVRSDPYAGGVELDLDACRASVERCQSRSGVAALGFQVREWTASDVVPTNDSAPAKAVLRGGGSEASLAAHRCAARSAAPAASASDEIGFRCCRGPEPTGAYPEMPKSKPLSPLALDAEKARQALSSVEALADAAPTFEPADKHAIDAALRRGGRSRESIRMWTFPPWAFAWSPAEGELVWVLNGRTDRGALIALLYPLGDGNFAHAASTLIAEDEATIAIGFNKEYRKQLVWSTCWNCAGAGGIVRLGEDGKIAFTYR